MDACWDDIRLFLAVAEERSLSAAARVLEVGQATVSRRIARLEEELGYPLFTRSIDGVVLTDFGMAMLISARTMRDGALAFAAAARGKADELSGRVRLASPPGVAVDLVAPFAAALHAQHPGIRLESLSSVRTVDLARGEADLAIRMREPREPELAAAATGVTGLSVYGAASYCATLSTPCELSTLQWVGWSPPHEGLFPESWLRQHVEDYIPVFAADDFVTQERAMVSGLGAMLLPDLQARRIAGVQRITLTAELEKRLPRVPLYLVVAKSAWHSPRVRAVAQSLVDWLNIEAVSPLQMSLPV